MLLLSMKMEKIWKIYLWSSLSILVCFFNPLLVDKFGLGKQSYLLLTGLLGLFFWSILLVKQKERKIVWHPFLNWWLLMLVVGVISLLGRPGGIISKSIYYPWGIGTLFAMGIWWFLGMQAGVAWLKRMVEIWLWTGVFLSIFSLIIFVLPENVWPIFLPNKTNIWITLSAGFSIFGSLQAEVLFILSLVIVAIQRGWANYKVGSSYVKTGLMLGCLVLGLVAGGYRLSKLSVGWLGVRDSWTVGMQTISQSPINGIGLGNFVEGFWRYRPITTNNSSNWTGIYVGSIFGWLTWLVETGLLGFVVLGAGFWWILAYRKHSTFGWLLLVLVVLGWIGPWFWMVQLLVGVLIMGYSSNRLIHVNPQLLAGEGRKNVSGWIIFCGVFIGATVFSWWLTKPVLAEYYWQLGLQAVSKNDPNGAYNWQQKAALAAPWLAEIRRSYAQTNFALAQTIMQGVSSNKDKVVNDVDKQNLSVLLGQAIDEVKSAIALEPTNPNMWATLGLFYKNMVGTVDGSYDWAVQAYQQMAHVDPSNPLARIELGGLFFGAGDMESATKVFEEAVKIKPDLPNAWYNLAHATYAQSRGMGKESVARINKLQQAINYLQQATKLVSVDSQDFEKANKELSDWNSELAGLTKPSFTPTPTPILPSNQN